MAQGEIIETRVENGQVKYVAEYPDGYRVGGIITRGAAGRHTLITDGGMEQLADDMIGSSVDDPRQDNERR